MSDGLLNALQWYGAIAGAIAAFVVSLDVGRKPTGWAFVLFVTGSVAYVLWGFLNDEGKAVAWQNVVLFAINLNGVYRYLIRKKPVSA
ncbi:MAG: hypothetical protein JO013_16140 [Alphaproteobacteria bacterium]|nr:hypothetical protein [Alphaproteobacteria bacterium]